MYYSISLYWKDDIDNPISDPISGYIVKEGDFVEPETPQQEAEDAMIFYYIQSEKELKGLMEVDNGEDFVITSYEKIK